jgi:GPH family glycoside/pentoside/hexuronide:cation symporter
MNEEKYQISIGEKVGYGLGDTAANLVWRTLMVFLPIFYTDVFGLSAAAVGTLLLVCRYWDGITDFIMGLIADRTSTKWGKYRPWILWTALPFGITTILTFTTPDLSYSGKLVYAYLTYSALIIIYTANNIPYAALMGVMSSEPEERTSLSSYRFIFAFLGGLITQGLNIYLVEFFGNGDKVKGYKYTMTLFAVMSIIFFLITFLSTKERIKAAPKKKSSLKADIKDLFKNKPWIVLFFFGILYVAYTTLKYSTLMYYFTYYVGNVKLATAYMIIGLLAAMIGASTTRFVTHWWGKKMVVNMFMILGFITSILFYFCTPNTILLIFVLGTLGEFFAAPVVTLFFSMLADTADYSEWKNGRRATGLVFSAGTVAMKFGSGIAGAATGWILMTFGYVANTIQTAEALLGIRLLMSLFPALTALAIILLFQFYRIDENLLKQIEGDLIKQRNSSKQG